MAAKGWWGRVLWVDLSRKSTKVQELDGGILLSHVGGRGLAVRLLWDYTSPGVDPLSPENLLVFSAGPITALPGPSTGKLVVASKSPLTHGYGDGNLGTRAAVMLRWAGYDAVVFKGKSPKPVYVYVENEKVEFLDADDLWGLDTFSAEKRLLERHGKDAGVLLIGPSGERMVKMATVVSQSGRSGGRPGIGAVMGSKNLKAVVFRGDKMPEVAEQSLLRKTAAEAYASAKSKPPYSFWMRQGTMATIQWSQENSVLPTFNFSEGVFDESSGIDGFAMERLKVSQRGCPNCNSICGNVILDDEGAESELDYENVAMLGSNIGLGDLRKVARLNRLADMWGIDTIGLGSALGFAIEASQRGLLKDRIEWGDFDKILELSREISLGEGPVGSVLSEGVEHASKVLGCEECAVHVKGLSVSAYDCHAAPGMALSYGVSSVGAHHKDAWVISWEVAHGRFEYSKAKAKRVYELQRIRGGFFENLVACRLPWVELGLELDWYVKLFNYATGLSWTLDDHLKVADRTITLIRSYWVREYLAEGRRWGRQLDYPPLKWFTKPYTRGPLKGARLDPQKYDELLGNYYELVGWDHRGVPRASTLERLGLSYVRTELQRMTELTN
ncbi:aldehyde ferredoxin oxidoreductase family protein [Thermofilum pendens]|uniref:Aldehyde ferredoxin oxidoreductase n=1 Tax=Thermofilum pendens (strain DSM 2475 / Hrk 5) TaxID=368408 RepID=A1RWC4_THEPD|nr:aldehyde ferredoxin oxidoreductase family protein [Thermofilum pendens]ABL77504.1 Aldehyde ferredoxin oxidoreductase [Thermofilum pendens Hrk 5]